MKLLLQLFLTFSVGVVLTGCAITDDSPLLTDRDWPVPNDLSLDAELELLVKEASDIFGVDVSNSRDSGSERNFVGIRTDAIRFTRRIDSKTYLIQDENYGFARPNGYFSGADERIKEIAHRILTRLDISKSEVDEESVLTEFLQDGFVENGKVVLGEKSIGPKKLVITRNILDIPVFSSQLSLNLSKDESIGNMELHWPEIPTMVLVEAKRLNNLVESGWTPPSRKGAKPESTNAGIIHSPAIGFAMDIYPAIRVVYSSNQESIGRKLVLYFDRHGQVIPVPRVFTNENSELLQRWSQKRSNQSETK